MKNVLELLYYQTRSDHKNDSAFVALAQIKVDTLEQLKKTLTEEQNELLEAYFDADAQIQNIMDFDRFRCAFHLGAQLMDEINAGKKAVIKIDK